MNAAEVVLNGKHARETGLRAYVDECDFDRISAHIWFLRKLCSGGKHYFYAGATIDGKDVFLHRFLLNAQRSDLVDHQDHDTLNCLRGNIRICTHAQNMQNRKVLPQSTTGVKGVHFVRRENVFTAEIKVDNRRVRLGRFRTLEQAASAYRKAAIEYHGEFANFG